MSTLADIKRIFWHEIGHLCADILKVEADNSVKITTLNISHTNYADDSFKWSGFVEVLPETNISNMPKEQSKMAYWLISLHAGCIFETIYFNRIEKDLSKKFEGCFNMNKESIGNGDWHTFHSIVSEILKTYPKLRGKKDLIEYFQSVFKDTVKEAFYKLTGLIEGLTRIIDEEVLKIEDDFKNCNSSTKYIYEYKDEELEGLIEQVNELLNQHDFRELIEKLHETFLETYSFFLCKYDVSQ